MLFLTWQSREMKREKKFFLEQISCEISRMKSDYSIESLRGPKEKGKSKPPTEGSTKLQYDDMIPGSPKGKHSRHKSKRFFPKLSSHTHDRNLYAYTESPFQINFMKNRI